MTSEPGKGSEFTFVLPLATQPLAPEERPYSKRFSGEPVLVVDDNQTNLRLLAAMLSQMGLKPTCVNKASEAIHRVKAGPARPLILLDAQMPEMDGVSLALELSVLPQTAESHIIMLSSMSRHFDSNMLKRIGIKHYLHKPIAQDELHQAIAAAFERLPKLMSEAPRASRVIGSWGYASCWLKIIWSIRRWQHGCLNASAIAVRSSTMDSLCLNAGVRENGTFC